METVLNEISAYDIADSQDEVKVYMRSMLELLNTLNSYQFTRLRLPDQNFFNLELSAGYTLNNWLTDPSVNQTLKTLFMGLKAYPYFEELSMDAENQYLSSTFTLDEPEHSSDGDTVDGLADAYLRNTLAVSFNSHNIWAKCLVSIKNSQEKVSVIHASNSGCLDDNFKQWYKQRTRPPLNSHADVDLWFEKSKNDLIFWYQKNQMDKLVKIESFLDEIKRTPFTGSGQVEPLKANLSGWWSRRINQEHRLVYRVEEDNVILCSCRGHYERLNC
jgi:toxin YoeB